LISRSRPLPLGDTGTSTLVIVPSVTVIATCTGPHRVSADAPVYVFVPVEEPADEEDPEADGEGDGSGGAVADGVLEGAAGALVEVLPDAVAGVLVEVW
jgi:hypothetical protein